MKYRVEFWGGPIYDLGCNRELWGNSFRWFGRVGFSKEVTFNWVLKVDKCVQEIAETIPGEGMPHRKVLRKSLGHCLCWWTMSTVWRGDPSQGKTGGEQAHTVPLRGLWEEYGFYPYPPASMWRWTRQVKIRVRLVVESSRWKRQVTSLCGWQQKKGGFQVCFGGSTGNSCWKEGFRMHP
jgi:hypothetical protein